jgi:hypothetical protein
MTTTTNARIAGVTFLVYIAAGMTSIYVSTLITGGAEDTGAKIAALAEHKSLAQFNILLTLLSAVCALVLAVTIYGLTHDADRELAVMALCCRVAEGTIIVMATLFLIASSVIATNVSAGTAADPPAFIALAAILFEVEGSTGLIAGLCFAFGSVIYCYLFLRTRRIPTWLAWLGLISSIVLVILLPLRIADILDGPVTIFMWLPMLLFEVIFAMSLMTRGIRRE